MDPFLRGEADCADGGAEWVYVERGGASKKVTFDAGAEVHPVQDLVEQLRALRIRLSTD